MRDLDHWKDKVEVTLDGRQLFFLFFGGAVITATMFCLGVMTGRRLEARALALQPPTIDDPLAALDQLGDVEEEGLTFHNSLTHNGKGSKGKSAPTPPVASASGAPAAAAAAANEASAGAPTAPAPGVGNKPAAAAAKPAAANGATPSAKDAASAAAPTPVPPSQPGHFTLQLSAFAEKSDADAFVKRMQTMGYKPFVVASEIPGKGVFYRVRLGDYTNRESATAAKEELEKKQSVVAYVTKL